MTREQINEVEDIVNKEILRNAPTQTRVMPIDEAKKTKRSCSSEKNTVKTFAF